EAFDPFHLALSAVSRVDDGRRLQTSRLQLLRLRAARRSPRSSPAFRSPLEDDMKTLTLRSLATIALIAAACAPPLIPVASAQSLTMTGKVVTAATCKAATCSAIQWDSAKVQLPKGMKILATIPQA